MLSRVHSAYAAVRERAERAEVRLEMTEAQREQEAASSHAYKVGGLGLSGCLVASFASMCHKCTRRLPACPSACRQSCRTKWHACGQS